MSWTREGYQAVNGGESCRDVSWGRQKVIQPSLSAPTFAKLKQTNKNLLIARTAARKHAVKTQLLLNLSVHPTWPSPDLLDRMILSSSKKESRNPRAYPWYVQDQGETLATCPEHRDDLCCEGQTRLEGQKRELMKKGKWTLLLTSPNFWPQHPEVTQAGPVFKLIILMLSPWWCTSGPEGEQPSNVSCCLFSVVPISQSFLPTTLASQPSDNSHGQRPLA